MKKLKNMVAVIVCLSVMLIVPAHAQLTSTESGWLNTINQNLNTLKTYFNSTSLANNPIAYYLIQIEDEVETWHGNAISFYQKFDVGGRVDNYFWDWTSLFSKISSAVNSSMGSNQTLHDLSYLTYLILSSNLPSISNGINFVWQYTSDLIDTFNQAFDADTHGTSKDIYSMIFEAYQDNIVPAEETDKTIYELLYDMHTELGGYEEGNYGYTLYGTLNEQLNVLKLREPIWEYELEEFNKNKFTYEFIGDNFTSGTDSETSLGMDAIMSMYELLQDVNTDLKEAGRQSDFLDEYGRVNDEGSGWFSSDTQNALDSVPQVMLFSDDVDPYNMNDYYEQWEVLSDVVH